MIKQSSVWQASEPAHTWGATAPKRTLTQERLHADQHIQNITHKYKFNWALFTSAHPCLQADRGFVCEVGGTLMISLRWRPSLGCSFCWCCGFCILGTEKPFESWRLQVCSRCEKWSSRTSEWTSSSEASAPEIARACYWTSSRLSKSDASVLDILNRIFNYPVTLPWRATEIRTSHVEFAPQPTHVLESLSAGSHYEDTYLSVQETEYQSDEESLQRTDSSYVCASFSKSFCPSAQVCNLVCWIWKFDFGGDRGELCVISQESNTSMSGHSSEEEFQGHPKRKFHVLALRLRFKTFQKAVSKHFWKPTLFFWNQRNKTERAELNLLSVAIGRDSAVCSCTISWRPSWEKWYSNLPSIFSRKCSAFGCGHTESRFVGKVVRLDGWIAVTAERSHIMEWYQGFFSGWNTLMCSPLLQQTIQLQWPVLQQFSDLTLCCDWLLLRQPQYQINFVQLSKVVLVTKQLDSCRTPEKAAGKDLPLCVWTNLRVDDDGGDDFEDARTLRVGRRAVDDAHHLQTEQRHQNERRSQGTSETQARSASWTSFSFSLNRLVLWSVRFCFIARPWFVRCKAFLDQSGHTLRFQPEPSGVSENIFSTLCIHSRLHCWEKSNPAVEVQVWMGFGQGAVYRTGRVLTCSCSVRWDEPRSE